MKEIRSICIRGIRQEDRALPCQDSVCSARSGTVTAIALSDGTGRDIWATIGAKTTSLCAARFCADHFHELAQGSAEELRYALLSHIRTALFHMNSDTDASVQTLGATCVIAAVDRASGRMLLAHLGDGCIAARDRLGRIRVLSYPNNGISKTHTNLTTDFRGDGAIRVAMGSADALEELLLYSDGWVEDGVDAAAAAERAFQFLEGGTDPDKTRFYDDVSAISLRIAMPGA